MTGRISIFPIVTTLALIALLAAPASAAPLHLDKVRISLKAAKPGKPSRHSVNLSGTFACEQLPERFRPEAHPVSILFGDVAILDEANEGAGAWSPRSATRWTYSLRSGSTLKLRLDFSTGMLSIRGRRLDLAGVHNPARVLRVTLRIGETSFGTAVECREKGERWSWRPPKADWTPPPAPDTPVPGEGPHYRLLVDTYCDAADEVAIWENHTVLRNEWEWARAWFDYLSPWMEYPQIEDGVEMVVTLYTPGQILTWFEVTRVDDGLSIRYKTGYLPHTGWRPDYKLIGAVTVPWAPGPVTIEKLPD